MNCQHEVDRLRRLTREDLKKTLDMLERRADEAEDPDKLRAMIERERERLRWAEEPWPP